MAKKTPRINLEALRNPYAASCDKNGKMRYYYTKEKYLEIETALKRLEKQDEVLEIIKEYPFIIKVIQNKWTYHELEIQMPNTQLPSKAEYKLLKEYFK